MATVQINVAVVQGEVPVGSVAGKWEIGYQDSAAVIVKQDVDAPTATFTNVAPGDYIALAKRLDTNGAPFGPNVALVFNVPEVAVTSADVPATITVVLS